MSIEGNAIEIDPNAIQSEPEPVADPTLEVVREPSEVEEEEEEEEFVPVIPIGVRSRRKESAYSVHDPRRQSPPNERGLGFTLLDEDEFQAGESYTIRVLVEETSGNKQKALPGVGVSVKILGTAFRPQMYSVRRPTRIAANLALDTRKDALATRLGARRERAVGSLSEPAWEHVLNDRSDREALGSTEEVALVEARR